MKSGFRQSMAWLHTWSGLLLGWVMFTIFLTGTAAYFRQEITLWMQPELHRSVASANTPEMAFNRMAELAPDAAQWSVALPGERSEAVSVSWRDHGARPNDRNATKRAMLDAGTGEVLTPRETAGGNFLYRFHFELYGIPRDISRWIICIATMAMLVAIISGIITHRRIFKDFFTFRPDKALKRSWMDGHAVTAVLALPYHLMITYSGLLFFMVMLMPYGVDLAYDGNRQAYFAESSNRRMVQPVPPAPEEARMTALGPLLAIANDHWSARGGVGSFTVVNPRRANATIEFRPAISTSAMRGGNADRMLFNGVTGEALESPPPVTPSGAQATLSVFLGLHEALFAGPVLRWIFFLSGLAGTVMVGSGLVLWIIGRRPDRSRATGPFGHRLTDWLNIATVAGLPVATAAYFWANRLLPVDMAGRPASEVTVFLSVWALAFLHAPLRKSWRGWVEQLGLGAFLFATLPVLNAITTTSHLGYSLANGRWLIAGFDLTVFALGIGLGFTAWKVARRANKPVPVKARKPARSPDANASSGVPVQASLVTGDAQ